MYCLLISSLPTSIIIRLIYDYANKILPPSFDKTWIRNSETEGYNLRDGNDFQNPRFHFSSHPYLNFSKQRNNLKKDFKLTIMHRSVFMSTLKNIYFTLIILVFVNFAKTIYKIWLITSTRLCFVDPFLFTIFYYLNASHCHQVWNFAILHMYLILWSCL